MISIRGVIVLFARLDLDWRVWILSWIRNIKLKEMLPTLSFVFTPFSSQFVRLLSHEHHNALASRPEEGGGRAGGHHGAWAGSLRDRADRRAGVPCVCARRASSKLHARIRMTRVMASVCV
jgi:hypothetical protein